MTAAVNNTTNTPATNTSTTNSAVANNNNQSQFLQLLTTQLKNQDPTSPANTDQVTQEIAMLSQVEQQTQTNSLLQQMISLLGSNQATTAVNYIGKEVDSAGNQTSLSSGVATLVYTLPSTVSSSNISITDSTGKVVFSAPGTTLAGRNQVMWNGTDSSGNKMPDGAYNFTVTAKDSSGKAVTPTTLTTGTVTGVETINGQNEVSLGNVSVPLTNIQSVYNPGTNPGA